MPPIFVVSLVREAERRARMREELKARRLDFEFFDAVDGAGLTGDRYRHRMQEQWWRIIRGRRLSSGEIGCFLSHYALWQHLVDTGTPYAVVLEDDAALEDGFPAIIDAVLRTDLDWDVVLLSPRKRYRVHRELAMLDGQRSLVRYRRRVGGCVGYLIRLEAAKALLHYCWRIRAPIDWLYAEWWRNGLAFYAVDPAIVTHTGVRSTIRTLPKGRRTAAGAHGGGQLPLRGPALPAQRRLERRPSDCMDPFRHRTERSGDPTARSRPSTARREI